MDNRHEATRAALRQQASWCLTLGSPLTAAVLSQLAAMLADAGGTPLSLVKDWPGDPVADALPLRLAGALHALALSKASPALAGCYPPFAPPADDRLRAALLAAIDAHHDFIQAFLSSPPQTNEAGRAAVLAGGFLRVAAATDLPLRLLEIGASAGLNLLWDPYRYRLGGCVCGDPASPLLLAPQWTGPSPRAVVRVQVAGRHGCDLSPIDLDDDAQSLRLRAYVWADQIERARRLDLAIWIARQVRGFRVERADAADWLRPRLAAPCFGAATVLFHSILWQYLPARTRDAITSSVTEAGARATRRAPLAWLRFEPPDARGPPELRLTRWPGGEETLLATAHPHGRRVAWLASD